MNIFELPWNVLLSFEGLLLVLIFREGVLTFRLNRHHPERGVAWFNVCILTALFIAAFAGGSALYLRGVRVALLFPVYPGARYAPERELFEHDDSSIFVTYDATDVITHYYERTASSSGFTVTTSDNHDATRVLFQKNDQNFFLTIVNTGNSRLLFYGKQGEVTVTPVHGR